MPTVTRLLHPAVLAAVLLCALAPTTAAATSRPFPNLSFGNHGSDVRAIQGLLRAHGVAVAIDAKFGMATREAVVAFQTAQGLTADGVRRVKAWKKRSVLLRPGAT